MKSPSSFQSRPQNQILSQPISNNIRVTYSMNSHFQKDT